MRKSEFPFDQDAAIITIYIRRKSANTSPIPLCQFALLDGVCDG